MLSTQVFFKQSWQLLVNIIKSYNKFFCELVGIIKQPHI